MPQDNPKSVVYRSLFSCDNPKGVAECKIARRSKTGSQKSEDMIANEKKLKNLNVSISYNQPGKESVPTDELHNPSSIQLREISRGARKLNQVVDTWSKGISFEGKPKDVAQDLFRGALDLQESLEMLGKLQEATQYMAKLKRKQKEKAGGGGKGKPDSMGTRRTSHQFGYEGHEMEYHKPKCLAGGSPKDCYEDLREVIREGLAKQNLLPKSSYEERTYFGRTKRFSGEKAYFDRRKTLREEKAYFDRTKSDNISLEFPSTSSSQSSMFHSCEFDTSDSSFQWSFEEKSKGPNVIAKLMGLGEDPSKSSTFAPQKQLGIDKSLNYGRPLFDMDLPKPRMPRFSVQKTDSQRRTLEELIQTVQFKGLLTMPPINTFEHQKQQLSRVSGGRKSLPDDSPPVVIIKPRHVMGSLEENLHKQKFICPDLDTKETIRKLKMKEVVPSRTSNVPKGALDVNDLQRKLQGETSPLEIPSQEKGDKYCVDASTGTYDRVIKSMEVLSPTKKKASVLAKPKVQMKGVTDDKGDKIQRLAAITRMPKEGDTVNMSDARNIRNINKIASIGSKKRDVKPNDLQDQISQLKATPPKSLEYDTLTAQYSSRNQKKKAKSEKLVSISASTLVEPQIKNEAVQIDHHDKHKHDLSAKKLTTSEKVPTCDETHNASKNSDYWNKNGRRLSGFTSLVKQKSDTKSTDKSSDATRNLLLGNPLFLYKVEELFHTDAYQPSVSGTTSSRDYGTSDDTKVLLDCAKELAENKSIQCTHAAHQFSHVLANKSKIFIFLDELVDEVCDGIEDLRRYHRHTGEKVARHALPKVLHKDLWAKGVVTGEWDMDWRTGFTPDEIEKIIVNIEQEILNGIVEDMLAVMVS